MWLPLAPLAGDPACNPGMCPDWESNWQPFGLQPALNPLSYTSPGELLLSCSNDIMIMENGKVRVLEMHTDI